MHEQQPISETCHEKTWFFFSICENKRCRSADGYRAPDQRLCFHALYIYIDSANPSTSWSQSFKPLAIFCGCTASLCLDLVRNPKVFSWRGSNNFTIFHTIIAGFKITYQNCLIKAIQSKVTHHYGECRDQKQSNACKNEPCHEKTAFCICENKLRCRSDVQ